MLSHSKVNLLIPLHVPCLPSRDAPGWHWDYHDPPGVSLLISDAVRLSILNKQTYFQFCPRSLVPGPWSLVPGAWSPVP
eukprot:12402148-Karenia_brevis.AAC.1